MRVGKSGYLNVDTHSQCWERRLQGNGLAYGVEPHVSSLRKPPRRFLHPDTLTFCMRRDGLSILKGCSRFFA